MKNIVIELLQQRQLEHIFNESDFKSFKRKTINGKKGYNEYFAALAIFDMFMLNPPPIV